jgi:hypothetical protein
MEREIVLLGGTENAERIEGSGPARDEEDDAAFLTMLCP